MEIRNTKAGDEATLERQRGSARSSGLGRKLDPALKSLMDNVIIPALVREYLAEMEKRVNRGPFGGCGSHARGWIPGVRLGDGLKTRVVWPSISVAQNRAQRTRYPFGIAGSAHPGIGMAGR